MVIERAANSGYIKQSRVISAFEDAGFELIAESEINANPKDTRDHPFGVWTLPPVRRSSPRGEAFDPNFDRTKYDAIGESDRMTLKFRKPAATACRWTYSTVTRSPGWSGGRATGGC